MLTGLTRLHDALADALGGLAALTDRDRPDAARLARRRLDLIRASIARGRFIEFDIYPRLRAALPDAAEEPIRELRSEAVALRVLSAQHVGQWTIDAAIQDWRGYGAASRTLRAVMQRQISTEQSRLYPLLSRISARPA